MGFVARTYLAGAGMMNHAMSTLSSNSQPLTCHAVRPNSPNRRSPARFEARSRPGFQSPAFRSREGESSS
jgi:hypothetical protein